MREAFNARKEFTRVYQIRIFTGDVIGFDEHRNNITYLLEIILAMMGN